MRIRPFGPFAVSAVQQTLLLSNTKHIMSADGLCKTVDPYSEQTPVFVKTYHEHQYTLTIRPFCVSTDMETIYKWLEHQLGVAFDKEDSPRAELTQSYIDILQSDCSQSLLCLLDGRPVCQLDIGKASLNEVFMYTDTGEEDYAFRFVMSPSLTIRDAYTQVLEIFIGYFFSFGNVKRLFTYLPVYDEWANHLLKNAGFGYLDTRRTLYGAVNLYECACLSEPTKEDSRNIS